MKTIRPFLFLLPLCFICSTIHSQNEHIIKLKPSKIEFENRHFFIAQVLDKRPNKSRIGAVLTGSEIIKANFSQPFTVELHHVFDMMAPYQSSNIPLTVVINSFSIQEHTEAGANVGTTALEVEVFYYQDSLNSLATIHAKKFKKAGDVTRKHPKIILEALEDCLQQINKIALEDQQVVQNYGFNLHNIKTGIYNSASAFLTNKPLEGISYKIIKKDIVGKYDHFKLDFKDKSKKIKNVYAVYDKGDIYLNAAQYTAPNKSTINYFVKAELTGAYIYFEDRVSSLRRSGVGVGVGIASGAIAGLVGGAVVGLASIKKMGFVLNTKSGELLPLTRETLVELLQDYPQLKFAYNQSKRKIKEKKEVIQQLNLAIAAEETEK